MSEQVQCWCRGFRSRQKKHPANKRLSEETLAGIQKHCPCCNGTGYCDNYYGRCGIETIDFDRASGEVTCSKCKKLYREHSFAKGLDGYDGPFLHELCDGSLVKL